MEEIIICPECGEKENFHFNYDWSNSERPVIDVLCNECGEVFKLKPEKRGYENNNTVSQGIFRRTLS